MSDGQENESGAGSAEVSAPRAGLGSQAVTKPPVEGAQAPIDWRLSITDENVRTSPTIQQLKANSASEALDTISKQLVNAQKMVGVDKIPKLRDGATPEERREYLSEYFGAPKDKGEYDFGLPDDAGDDIKEVAGLFQDIAFENGVGKDEAKAFYDKVGEYFSAKQEAIAEQNNAKIKEGLDKLHEEWGERFDGYLSQAQKAAERVGGDELAAVFESNPELANNPAIIKAFQKMAVMLMEDAPAGTNSNFARGANPGDAIKSFENSTEWKGLLSKALKGNLEPAERSRYNQLVEQRTMIYESSL